MPASNGTTQRRAAPKTPPPAVAAVANNNNRRRQRVIKPVPTPTRPRRPVRYNPPPEGRWAVLDCCYRFCKGLLIGGLVGSCIVVMMPWMTDAKDYITSSYREIQYCDRRKIYDSSMDVCFGVGRDYENKNVCVVLTNNKKEIFWDLDG